MKITFKLFAMLADHLPADRPPGNAVELDVPEGSTVASVVGTFQLPTALVHLVLVNGSYVAPEHRATKSLAEGDVLAIWPPIAGG